MKSEQKMVQHGKGLIEFCFTKVGIIGDHFLKVSISCNFVVHLHTKLFCQEKISLNLSISFIKPLKFIASIIF